LVALVITVVLPLAPAMEGHNQQWQASKGRARTEALWCLKKETEAVPLQAEVFGSKLD